MRRARVELQGTFIGHFDFHIAGEFTTTPATGSLGALADAYIIADYLSFLKIQVGQFDAPFSLENRTSDKYLDFIERGPTIRYLAVPVQQGAGRDGLGLAAEADRLLLDRRLQRRRPELQEPGQLGHRHGPRLRRAGGLDAARRQVCRGSRQIEVGGSFWWQHEGNLGGAIAGASGGTQNDLTGMSTTGGFGLFSSNYNVATDAAGNNIREHLVPSGGTVKWGVEMRVPIWKFGIQGELIHVSEIFSATTTRSTCPTP